MVKIEIILEATRKTQNTVQKKSYLISLDRIILKIKEDLKTKKYKPKIFSCFAVQDPKIREIFAPHYQDRIVHHILVEQLEKEIDPRLIFDSYANRKEKGCQVAVQRLQSFCRSPKTQFYIQLDLHSFFTSINKTILFQEIRKQMTSSKIYSNQKMEKLINLCQNFIFHNPTEPKPIFTGNQNLLKLVPPHKSLFHCSSETGLPIGSLTSQFFANVYLNKLDQYIKHNLKIKFFVRYVDDFVILSDSSAELLEWKNKIDLFLRTELKLHLHPKKVKLQHKTKGIDFLGYIVKADYLLLRKRVIKNFKRRLYFFNHLLNPQKFPLGNPPPLLNLTQKLRRKELIPPLTPTNALLYEMLAVINGYYGHFKIARSFRLRQTIYHKHFHELKKYFEPKNGNWQSLQIKKR